MQIFKVVNNQRRLGNCRLFQNNLSGLLVRDVRSETLTIILIPQSYSEEIHL